jgi:hypothetical protein
MNRLAGAVFSVVLTLSLAAADAPKATRLKPDPGRLSRIVNKVRAAKADMQGCVGAQAIAESRTARSIVFPAAGSVRGAGGEFFRSDVTLDGDTEKAVVFFLGRGATGEPPAFIVRAHGDFGYPITYTDFVGTTLNLPNSLGALWIFPWDELEKDVDPSGVIDGFSRIWTNQPGATGTVSQQFQAVDPLNFAFYYDTNAIGLQHNAQYRTSWGIVNLDSVPHTYNVFATSLAHNTESDLRITIPAYSMQQQNISRDISFGSNGMSVYIRLVDDFEDEVPPFVAYATSTDNTTGDGWVVLSSADWEDEDF